VIIWSCQLKNKQYYIDQFRSTIDSWRIQTVDQTWYKPRYEWRLAFDFGDPDRRHFYTPEWREMRDYFELHNWKYRRRAECYCVIFTNELDLLDAVLHNELWKTKLKELAYANENYLHEFTKQVGIDAVTDIKFVKKAPLHCYQVNFDNFDWRRTDEEVKLALTEYICTNIDEFHFIGSDQNMIQTINERKDKFDRWGNRYTIGNGFKLYTKSTDDIIMLHMVAPGKISKIIKLMEKSIEANIS